jgi:hypothetical protein
MSPQARAEAAIQPTTEAGRQLVDDIERAIATIKRETENPVVKLWMEEVGPTLVQLVRVGVILTEKEARAE